MRNKNGQFIKGSTGNPNGRPKRADEQFLVDLWSKHGQKQFAKSVKAGEQWALKLLADKLYANKRESSFDVTFRPEPRPLLANLVLDDEKEPHYVTEG